MFYYALIFFLVLLVLISSIYIKIKWVNISKSLGRVLELTSKPGITKRRSRRIQEYKCHASHIYLNLSNHFPIFLLSAFQMSSSSLSTKSHCIVSCFILIFHIYTEFNESYFPSLEQHKVGENGVLLRSEPAKLQRNPPRDSRRLLWWAHLVCDNP